MAFQLSSHEVMRGIKVRRGRLVLRPSGTAMAEDVFAAGVLGFATAPLIVAGWWLLAPVVAYLVIDKLAVLWTSVVADDRSVTVQNRWTRRHVRFTDILQITTVEATWWYRRPVLIGVSDDGVGWSYLIGVMIDRRRTLWCDAIVSRRGTDEGGIVDPPPAAMKVAALDRWVAEHQRSGAG